MKQRFSLPIANRGNIQPYIAQDKSNSSYHLYGEELHLRSCEKFRKFTVQLRLDYVYQNNICCNCISSAHTKIK